MSGSLIGEFVHVQKRGRHGLDIVSLTASQLYEAENDYSQPSIRKYFEDPRFFREGKPAELIVNRAGLGHAAWYAARLIVSEPLRDVIASCCRVRFVQVKFAGAFCLPVDIIGEEAGLQKEDQLKCGLEVPVEDIEWPQHWIARLAQKYKCDLPQMSYYELVAAAPYDLGIDPKTLPAYSNCPRRDMGELRVSRQLLNEFGILVCMDYAMRVDIWEQIQPYLNMPLFDAIRVKYNEQ